MRFFWLMVLIYACLTLTVKGQQVGEADLKRGEEERNKSINTAINTGVISNLSSVNLTSLFNTTRAEIKLGFPAGRSTFNAGVSQSFSEKPESAKLLDATGLTPGSTLSITWQYRLTPIPIPRVVPIRDMAKFEKFKAQYKAGKKVIPDSVSISFKVPDSIRVRVKVPVNTETSTQMLDNEEVGWDDFDNDLKAKVLNSGALDLRAFESPWFFTIQLSASRTSFDYIADTLATKPLSNKQTNRRFELSLSKFASADVYYSLSYSVLYAYSSGDDIIPYSFPVGSQGLTYSKDVTIGTPTEKIETRLKGELRQLFRDAEFTPVVGINPSISTLLNSEKINIDLPVYFLTKNQAGLLNGLQAGFRIGYTSKWDESFWRDLGSLSNDKVYFSLLLAKPFSVSK